MVPKGVQDPVKIGVFQPSCMHHDAYALGRVCCLGVG